MRASYSSSIARRSKLIFTHNPLRCIDNTRPLQENQGTQPSSATWTGNILRYSAISLFTGAGGLDYGLEAASFETTVAVEMDAHSCETLRQNRPDWGVIEAKIEDVPTKQILSLAGLKRREPDLLHGGPPCQPFSKSAFWINGDVKRLKDPRAKTLHEYMRVLEETLPRVFLLENVFGLAYKGKDEGLQFLKKRIEEINRRHGTKYSFSWDVINAADFGVPQIRERVFIIGARDGKIFKFPKPRFYDPENPPESVVDMLPYRTAWDALHDLTESRKDTEMAKVGGRWGILLPTIPEGSNYLFHSERGDGKRIFKWRSRYWSFLLKLAKNRPSWTIQAQPGSAIGPFHWNNRRLTTREMARLQTFPDDVQIAGDRGSVQRQIGNAVPSAIGELLGREIRRQFFGERLRMDYLKLIPEKAPRVGRATSIQPLSRSTLKQLRELS